ncbi:Leu/Ile/Val-binding protein [Polaribacter huanghezhanensis]|uniref:ABC transporter substrate-binding protein n=1 Tax=Polaribacter huanghezhanensis TaxID=1354726 RepID=UPI0026484437|nr:ABC transporter substrate-binding protein [Polaribacter huanghezhanensis]WKD85318.1 Leu/Ile/Val-binding protein [Polaribacter huanghezhanensis]
MNNNKNILKRLGVLSIFFVLIFFMACQSKVETINIGYIGPLTTRATDLGIAPSKAIQLAVEEYNETRLSNEPKVDLFIEDDQWDKEKGLIAYEKLRKEHKIKVLFISNTDGTIAISEKAKEDKVIIINPCNNDTALNKLNENVFKIAKSTEEAHSLIANRIIDLDFKKVIIIHYPNNFMYLGAFTCKEILKKEGIETKVVSFKKEKTNFMKELTEYKAEDYDAYVFLGYKEYGFAMKQARELGIESKFFGSTVLLQEDYYENSDGAIIGTEFIFFTPQNGNYVPAQDFLNNYQSKFKEKPFSVWPPMQAYDAANILLSVLKNYNITNTKNNDFDSWLRKKLLNVHYFEGVCGNISIKSNGASSGIYFSLYEYKSKGKFTNIKE